MKTLLPGRRSGCLTLLVAAGSLGFAGCTYLGTGHSTLDLKIEERGMASWYGEDFHGRATASGEVYDMYAMTAAHRSLPLGTAVTVLNVVNGREVVLEVNDRGPYKKGRVIDLSLGAARRLGLERAGIGVVRVTVIAPLPHPVHAVAASHGPAVAPAPGPAVLSEASPPATVGRARPRVRPTEIRRFPRLRRVADILHAEHVVYRTTAGLLLGEDPAPVLG